MNQQLLLLLIGVGVALIMGITIGMQIYRSNHTSAGVLDRYNRKRRKQREAAKGRIIKFIRSNSYATNRDIRILLGVSSRSAHRYLDELEKDGKLKQSKNRGRAVQYTLK